MDKAEHSKEKAPNIFVYMSGTGRRLMRWEKAELITRPQLLDILAYEKENNGKRMFRSLVGIALFAIAVGILSIIAANWVHIPGHIKLAGHFCLNLLAAISIWKYDRAGKNLYREGAVGVLFALNLTMIVLMGQVFHLDGSYASALSLWLMISSPTIFFYGRSAINALLWVLAFLATVACVLWDVTMQFEPDGLQALLILLAAGLYMPLILIAASAMNLIHKYKEQWVPVLFRVSMIIFAVQATCGSFLWYGDMGQSLTRLFEKSGSFMAGYLPMVAVIFSAPVLVYGFELLRKQTGKKIVDRTAIIFIVGSIISATLPLLVMSGDVALFAAIHFCAYWIFAGWVGHRMGYDQLMNAAISLVTLRIIVIYFELFGGLVMTGFGLIFSGVLMLFILKTAMKIKQKISAA